MGSILGRRFESTPKNHKMRLTQGYHAEVDPVARVSSGQSSPAAFMGAIGPRIYP
jgi:hypothetical protein